MSLLELLIAPLPSVSCNPHGKARGRRVRSSPRCWYVEHRTGVNFASHSCLSLLRPREEPVVMMWDHGPNCAFNVFKLVGGITNGLVPGDRVKGSPLW